MSSRSDRFRAWAVLAAVAVLGMVGGASAASITWTGGVNANWNINTTANWTGDATVYNEGDAVTFDDGSTNPDTVTLTTTLNPGSVTVDADRAYTFGGTGKLAGATGITKSGSGTLTLGNANTFTGAVTISGGIVKLNNAAALGSTTGGTVVNGGTTLNPGGTLDLLGGTKTFDEQITVQGVGVNGQGVLISTVSGTPIVNNLVLAGDATLGGSERVDIRSTPNFGNYTLTVDHTAVTTGNNNGVRLTGSPSMLSHNLKDAHVVQGLLSFHSAMMGQADGTITVTHNPNTTNVSTLQIMRTFDYNTSWTLTKNLVFTGGRLHNWRGDYTLAGTMELNANEQVTQTEINIAAYHTTYKNALSIDSLITGDGGMNVVSGNLTLRNANTYTGNTTITAGKIALGPSGSISNSAVIDVLGTTATFDVSAVTGGFTLANGQTLKGNGAVTGNVATVAGSQIAPGASIGTLTLNGSLALDGTLAVEYDGTTIDMLTVNGDLDLAGGLFSFSQYGAALTEESYTFLTYTGTRTGLAGGAAPVGYQVAYDDVAKTVGLAIIPEPSTLILMVLGLMGVMTQRRRS
ncbi:MAG TPA: autotransporter-associated beta strand repeat-containing protein [Thermoguttaceae bacterium]|nr:autotransporter-associated beta strand repeat-containing protein [Thermoguttaceae bacterium]